MANELDKTIEELEAEVLEELEEAEHGTQPKANATATDPMQKAKKNPEDANVQTIPGSTPDKVAPHGGAAGSKSVSQDKTIPKKGKADKMDTAKDAGQNRPLASSYDPMEGYTDDEIRELCHSKHPLFMNIGKSLDQGIVIKMEFLIIILIKKKSY